MSLNINDSDTTATGNIYKGVELYPGDGINVGMFGMDKTITAANDLCLATEGGERICSTYPNYVDYSDA